MESNFADERTRLVRSKTEDKSHNIENAAMRKGTILSSFIGFFNSRFPTWLVWVSVPLTLMLLLLLLQWYHHQFPYTFSDPDPRHLMPSLLSVQEKNDNGGFKIVNALSNPLYEEMKIAHFDLEGVKEDHSDYVLHTDKTMIHFHDQLVLSWRSSLNLYLHDVIALYCPASQNDPKKFRDAASIDQIFATMQSTRGLLNKNKWIIDSFPVIKQDTCEFRVYERDLESSRPSFFLRGSSGPISIINGSTQPTLIHLALTGKDNEMLVHFATGQAGTSIVLYGNNAHDVENNFMNATSTSLQTGNSTTYAASDMCASPANIEEPGKFTDPNMLHTVTMSDLQPDTKYYYKVGILLDPIEKDNVILKNVVWSDIFSFHSPIPVGAATINIDNEEKPMTIIAYADQGIQGYGNYNNADRVALFTDREVENHSIAAIHHFGDLAYAQGSGHTWDAWFDMIEPFAAQVPLMIGIGNHEYDYLHGGIRTRKDPSGLRSNGYHPRWGNFGPDSNGECGVPTSKRFKMPSSPGSNGVFWYSFDQGLLHTIVLSSEHDLTPSSLQYKWLERDLSSINRTLTPWVIVEAHRPMYHIEDSPANTMVGIHMRTSLEPLLNLYNVDLLLSGHYHSYFRSCKGLYQGLCNNGGLTHITVGTAGAELDHYNLLNETWVDFYKSEWGYGRITILNDSHLKWEFVSIEDGTIHDDVMLEKKVGKD